MTQDNAMDVSPSWQELDAWREAALEAWEQMPDQSSPGDLMLLGNALRSSPDYTARRHKARVSALEVERDALALHVSNSNADMLVAARNIREKAKDDRHLHGVADMLERSAGEKPTATSLARFKAEWQADLLDEIGPGFVDIIDRSQAKAIAKTLRRQAEEGTS